ncbi:MAG: hypothetical protein QM660_05680 [Dysgonomonas sp.]
MKNLKEKGRSAEFTGYEEARKKKTGNATKTADPKAVKAALNRINPDENTQERG